jgi:5-methylcytosine-specific restriction enzyme subunit McrC
MNRVFEEFVRVALREALHEPASRFGTWRELYYGGKVQRLYFDEDYRKELEPDLLWAPDGTLRFVGDAKYKRIFADNMPNADLYQMLAYIVAANLPSGLLIYPKDEAEETTLRVAKLGRTIETRTLESLPSPKTFGSPLPGSRSGSGRWVSAYQSRTIIAKRFGSSARLSMV